jgi:hypothetical protein
MQWSVNITDVIFELDCIKVVNGIHLVKPNRLEDDAIINYYSTLFKSHNNFFLVFTRQ